VHPYSDHCDMRHHVRLCLEGIPAHAWNESIAKRVVARACDIDYLETQSLRRNDTRALCMWAWTYNPSDIPKVTWLTITGKAMQVHDGVAPHHGWRGQTFRVLVHLDILELPPNSHGRTEAREFIWRYGVVDGVRNPRDCHVPPPPDSKPRRHRDVDNNNIRRGRREDCGDNWGTRLFQSLPRDPGQARERERSESRHGWRDKSSAPNGRQRNIQRSSSPGPDGIEGQGRLNSPSPPRRARSDSATGRTQPTSKDPAHPHHPASMDAGALRRCTHKGSPGAHEEARCHGGRRRLDRRHAA
jgi:hypothetical protein